MSGTIPSLLWKEWHEQRWRMAFGCVLMAALPAIGLTARILPDIVVLGMTMVAGAFLLPIFAAMGLVAPERAERTLPSLLSLPVSGWWVLTIKVTMGLAICVLPMVCAAIMALLMAAGREVSWRLIVLAYAAGSLFGGLALVWIMAFSVRQPTEARVGLVGMAVIAGWMFATMLSEAYLFENAWVGALVKATVPFDILVSLDRPERFSVYALVLKLLIAAVLFGWAESGLRRTRRERS